MPSEINWGLANGPSSFDNALARGLQLGQMIRQRQDEKEYKNALAQYDPANPETLKPVMAADPRLGLQLQGKLPAHELAMGVSFFLWYYSGKFLRNLCFFVFFHGF